MKRIFIVCLLLGVLSSSLYAEQDSTRIRLESFVKNIQAFNHLYQQEKVYLHFDNTGYFIGESIWFKAYVTTASQLKTTPMSRVLYVELLDLEGTVLNTQKFLISNGQADGAIPLTRLALKSGFYEVRAYTRLMLNWDTQSLFSRVFPIFEKPEAEGSYDKKTIRLRSVSYKIPTKRAQAPSAKKLNVDFYPEGGQLINGLTSTVAFKVTDKEGRPQEATGCICNAQGDTISVFSTVHEGMGSFIYTPDGGKSKIWIRSTDEKKGTSFTPPISELSGCVMQVQNFHPEQVRIQVSATPEYTSVPTGLTAMCRGKLLLFKMLPSVTESGYSLVIPKSELSPGVNQLTLFTSDGRVLSERLIFVPGYAPALNLEVRQNKSAYRPFEQVNMDLSVYDDENTPIETTLSLAVRDHGTEIPSVYQENIYTNLLLSSDLKGYISNPGYYFESDDRTHLQALDLLMLTQGYRRYSWKQMAGVTPFEAMHKIEKGIVIDGKIKSIVRKKDQENIDVKMTMFTDSSYQQAYCPTDTAGNFNYQAPDLYGKWDLQIETRKKNKRKEYWITMDRLFSPQGRPYSFHDTDIPEMKVSRDKTRFLLNNTESVKVDDLLTDSMELANATAGAKTLKELVVKGKMTRSEFVNRGISIVYDVPEEENKLEDKAGGYNEMIYEFLARINPYFSYDVVLTSEGDVATDGSGGLAYTCKYKGRPVAFNYASSYASDFGDLFTKNISSVSIGETFHAGESINPSSVDLMAAGIYKFSDLTSSDIESIMIIEDPACYTMLEPSFASSGKQIVVILLKLNTTRPKAREPIGVRLTSLQGFSVPRDFYSPNYGEYQLPKEDDFRRTLYWNPNVKTNSEGKASVSFFNNATCREMNISAETMTPEGVFGSYQSEE